MSFLKEVSAILNRTGAALASDVFEFFSDADRVHVHLNKLPKYFDKFGMNVDVSKIKIENNDTVVIPVTSQTYKGSFSSAALDKIKQELEKLFYFEFIDYNTEKHEIHITFLKKVELYYHN
jgi:hypothetical protein